MRPGRTRGEGGETLIEMMVTVVVVGLVFVALMGMVWTLIRVSSLERRTGTTEAVLRDFAEKVSTNTSPFAYVDCATGADDAVAANDRNPYPQYTSPSSSLSGYTATVVHVRYWDGTSTTGAGAFVDLAGIRSLPGGAGRCSGHPGTEDYRVQSLELRVTSPDGTHTETVDVIKRREICDDGSCS